MKHKTQETYLRIILKQLHITFLSYTWKSSDRLTSPATSTLTGRKVSPTKNLMIEHSNKNCIILVCIRYEFSEIILGNDI